MTDFSFIPVLASSGDSGYLYGLFFLIISLIIGAATRHFLQRIPLPFTVYYSSLDWGWVDLTVPMVLMEVMSILEIMWLVKCMEFGISLSILLAERSPGEAI